MSDGHIGPEKIRALNERMASLGIREAELEERFIRASGKGGQKLNKSSSCVYLKHIPSGIEIKCHKARARAMNRFFARRIIADRIEEMQTGGNSPAARKIEAIRKQKKKRSKRARQKAGAHRETDPHRETGPDS